MKSGKEGKQIRKPEAVGKILLTLLLIALELAVWPGYLVHDTYMSNSYSEYSTYSDPITEKTEIAQYFIPLYSRLDQLEFALDYVQEAAGDQVLQFALYDEKNTELMSQQIPMADMEAGHYYAIAVGRGLSKKQMYHWTLTIPENTGCDIRLMYAEHGTGVAPENMRLDRNGELFGAEDAQATVRYTYEIHPDKVVIIGGYWLGNALIYLVLMEGLEKLLGYWRCKRGTGNEAVG